ncbi:TLR4 interactor with leucine rich repeats [Megalops cyprinoides]|uniref:TLR4 interactor with leucine rich repeats n=1 Tax=Megalops cyprinoides TaxID=118141 RepID=UPI001863FFA5|nr:TLR4 interactor with leucine rich repeats [Megalops cyprinoides]
MARLLALCFLLASGALSARAICPERCDCQHAQHLLCTNRGLRAVPKAPARGSGDVLVLSLGGNFISNISAFDFSRFSHLTRLDLQYNQIRSVHSKAFDKLSRLEELYLGNNLISTISPGTFHSLRKLRILYGNSNEIKKISPDSFTNLESVIKLRLDRNAIETLQDAVFKSLENLLYLHLESNKLRHIHRSAFIRLGKLRFLNLSDNKQTTLRNTFTFAQLTSLTTLLLSENEIQHVGNHVFQNLKKLSKLSLSNNKIAQMDGEALKGLSGVRELLIDGNQLEHIPARLLDPLERVEVLDFSDNRISSVDPSAFKQLKHLKVLKLNNNRLSSLAGSVFSSNGGLYSLDLKGNNWTCDCRLGAFQQWMSAAHSQGLLLTVFVQCQHPAALTGKYLDYLNSSQLWPPESHSGVCGSGSGSVERAAGPARDRPTLQVNVQADEAEPDRTPTDQSKRKKPLTPRSRPPTRAADSPKRGPPDSGHPSATGHPPSTPTQGAAERFDLLQQEKAERPLVTDACQFNRLFILNVTAEQESVSTATVRWVTRDYRVATGSELHFRVLYDRFGQAPRFPRFVYVQGGARAVTLRELAEDTPYMACVEAVVGGAACAVASRDHCTGVVTQPAGRGRAGDLQLLTMVTLGANILLLLLVGGAWMGRGLRRRLQHRKSAVHVRHMYSTRRPLRAMATDAVSADFTSYQSSRPRLGAPDEGDLIQFPCERFPEGSRRD